MTNLENLSINDYIAIFRRRIWYVVVITILVTAGVVVYALQLPPIYRSETTIAMSARLVPEDYIRSIDRRTNSDQMDFVRQQLQSRTFLQGIIQEFRLAEPGPEGFSDFALAGVGKRIEISVLTTSAFKLAFTATDRNQAQAVTKRLAERVIQLNGSFRKEKVQSADQFLEEQLREAANELSTAEQKALKFRNDSFPGITAENVTPDNLRDLQVQLATLEAKLDAAVDQRKSLERRLTENRQLKVALKAPGPPPPDLPADTRPVTAAAPPPPPSALETQLTAKRAELAAASSRYTPLHPSVQQLTMDVRQLEAAVRAQQAQALAQAQVLASTSAPKQAAKQEVKDLPLVPDFPAIDLMPAEIQTELEQVTRDIAKMQRDRNLLAGRVASYQARLNPSPVVAQEQAQITREYDVAKQRYNYLSDKRLNSELATRVDTSDENEMFRVIDPANLPQRPSGPDRRMFASLGGLAGLILGLGFAFLRDFMDSTLHSEDHASAELKLPILAAIPIIPDEDRRDGEQVPLLVQPLNPDDPGDFSLLQADSKVRNVLLNPLCFEGEHYRLLQTRLMAMQKERKLKSLLISSANPHEGKTFTSCCIAGVLAQEPGKRVLLIDADLRRANLTHMLGFANKDTSRTANAVLAGEANLEESVARCAELNLYFLPADTKAFNPANMMSSDQLERVLSQATQAFDWVIIDSPPILAVADANRMFPYCDGMLLVVHSGKTPMKLIRDSIQRVGANRICGVLMNRVKNVQSSYYYGGYYQNIDSPPTKIKRKSSSKVSEIDLIQS
ncbi:MAG TPA: polysaccharide biosynthesis tyrosine autokinase [Terriglobia bacterium]|nr:polysaccharide biosynthesis tyrosine autokinase [Terriglobia bacterium]